MGVLGMFGLPVSITILIALHKTNKLSIWPLTKIFSDSEEEPEPCSTATEEASQQEKQTVNK